MKRQIVGLQKLDAYLEMILNVGLQKFEPLFAWKVFMLIYDDFILVSFMQCAGICLRLEKNSCLIVVQEKSNPNNSMTTKSLFHFFVPKQNKNIENSKYL